MTVLLVGISLKFAQINFVGAMEANETVIDTFADCSKAFEVCQCHYSFHDL